MAKTKKNPSRDRKFVSEQKWEKSYAPKRKTTGKRYGK